MSTHVNSARASVYIRVAFLALTVRHGYFNVWGTLISVKYFSFFVTHGHLCCISNYIWCTLCPKLQNIGILSQRRARASSCKKYMKMYIIIYSLRYIYMYICVYIYIYICVCVYIHDIKMTLLTRLMCMYVCMYVWVDGSYIIDCKGLKCKSARRGVAAPQSNY